MTKALICIDFINEIVGSGGKLAAKGYRTFVESHNTLQHVANLQAESRIANMPVIHVHLGFKSDYSDHPGQSPLLGGARAGGILQLGTSSTEIVDEVKPIDGDIVVVKKRISAFYDTGLESTLKKLGVDELIICGVATDLAVESAARDAHDRDFIVNVSKESCAAASDNDHDWALENIAKFARVI